MQIRFRYQREYVPDGVLAAVDKGELDGCDALVAFVAGRDTSEPAVVPVRLVTVVNTRRVANMVVFTLRLCHYPGVTRHKSRAELASNGQRYLDALISENDGKYFPVTTAVPPLANDPPENQDDAWIAIARNLALVPLLANACFIRVDGVYDAAHQHLPLADDGSLTLREERAAHVRFSYFTGIHDDAADLEIACTTDGERVKVISDAILPLGLRYDVDQFALYAGSVAIPTWSRLVLQVRSATRADDSTSNGLVPVRVAFPLAVRPARRERLFRVALSGVGAILVAMPAILAKDVPVGWRIGLAVAGAACLTAVTALAPRH